MSPTDKSNCLKFLREGLSPKPWIPFPGDKKVHEGPIKHWRNAKEPEFIKFLEKNSLSMDDYVTIWDQGRGLDGDIIYCVIHQKTADI